jgi:hypothetical protein
MSTTSQGKDGKRNMELKVEKFDSLIVENCKRIKKAHKGLTHLLRNYEYDHGERSQIDRNLVRLSVASQRITDLILPIPSTGVNGKLNSQAYGK